MQQYVVDKNQPGAGGFGNVGPFSLISGWTAVPATEDFRLPTDDFRRYDGLSPVISHSIVNCLDAGSLGSLRGMVSVSTPLSYLAAIFSVSMPVTSKLLQ